MIWLFSLLLIGAVNGYMEYQQRIPNGANISNPCLPGTHWPGVGHENLEGGGQRNAFGSAFELNDKV